MSDTGEVKITTLPSGNEWFEGGGYSFALPTKEQQQVAAQCLRESFPAQEKIVSEIDSLKAENERLKAANHNSWGFVSKFWREKAEAIAERDRAIAGMEEAMQLHTERIALGYTHAQIETLKIRHNRIREKVGVPTK